jgi:TAT (twin-arginine translocation) pathway signal sequence
MNDNETINRRGFLKTIGLGAAALAVPAVLGIEPRAAAARRGS